MTSAACTDVGDGDPSLFWSWFSVSVHSTEMDSKFLAKDDISEDHLLLLFSQKTETLA